MVRIAVMAAMAVALSAGVANAASVGNVGDINGNVKVNSKKVGNGSSVATGDIITVSSAGGAILTYSNGCKVKLDAGSVTKVDQSTCVFTVASESPVGTLSTPVVVGGIVVGGAVGAAIGYGVSQSNSGGTVYVPVSR